MRAWSGETTFAADGTASLSSGSERSRTSGAPRSPPSKSASHRIPFRASPTTASGNASAAPAMAHGDGRPSTSQPLPTE